MKIEADQLELQLVRDDDRYTHKKFVLDVTGTEGEDVKIELDGIQVGDLIADARDCGMPIEWPFIDGLPR